MDSLEQTIFEQKRALSAYLEVPMGALARKCAPVWSDWERLDRVLAQSLASIPLCQLLYAMNTRGTQISSNISPAAIDTAKYGQDLSRRPFLASVVPCGGLLLSEVYISRVSGRSCITAVQAVSEASRMLGFVAADFDLLNLPLPERPAPGEPEWRQIRGDPAVRDVLFHQQRVKSSLDERIEDVIAIMDELICERGVFHAKLHFGSSRATLWLTDDPYRYRIHVLNEIIDPAVCLAYPVRPYPRQAAVPQSLVRPVFERLRVLREADENVYLRSGSLNVMNGMVGLTFSCDGSHYMPVQEFLERDEAFWFGAVVSLAKTDG